MGYILYPKTLRINELNFVQNNKKLLKKGFYIYPLGLNLIFKLSYRRFFMSTVVTLEKQNKDKYYPEEYLDNMAIIDPEVIEGLESIANSMNIPFGLLLNAIKKKKVVVTIL